MKKWRLGSTYACDARGCAMPSAPTTPHTNTPPHIHAPPHPHPTHPFSHPLQNVPAGEISFRARVGRQHRLPLNGSDGRSRGGVIPPELGVVARYKVGHGRDAGPRPAALLATLPRPPLQPCGANSCPLPLCPLPLPAQGQGRVAQSGFTRPTWVEGELLVVSRWGAGQQASIAAVLWPSHIQPLRCLLTLPLSPFAPACSSMPTTPSAAGQSWVSLSRSTTPTAILSCSAAWICRFCHRLSMAHDVLRLYPASCSPCARVPGALLGTSSNFIATEQHPLILQFFFILFKHMNSRLLPLPDSFAAAAPSPMPTEACSWSKHGLLSFVSLQKSTF